MDENGLRPHFMTLSLSMCVLLAYTYGHRMEEYVIDMLNVTYLKTVFMIHDLGIGFN